MNTAVFGMWMALHNKLYGIVLYCIDGQQFGLSQKEDWGHCPVRDNPTDLGTRGLTAAKIREK